MNSPARLRDPEADRARRAKRREAGFTLIELLIVVAVLGIIAAIAVINLLAALDRARQRATMSDMRSISKAIEVYNIDKGYIPTSSGNLVDQVVTLTPYQISILPVRDHWGHLYGFASNGTNAYTITSYGKDGTAGTPITRATRNDYSADLILYNGIFTAAPE